MLSRIGKTDRVCISTVEDVAVTFCDPDATKYPLPLERTQFYQQTDNEVQLQRPISASQEQSLLPHGRSQNTIQLGVGSTGILKR